MAVAWCGGTRSVIDILCHAHETGWRVGGMLMVMTEAAGYLADESSAGGGGGDPG